MDFSGTEQSNISTPSRSELKNCVFKKNILYIHKTLDKTTCNVYQKTILEVSILDVLCFFDILQLGPL